jgi:transposase-like protein
MTDVTEDRDQDGVELSAADEIYLVLGVTVDGERDVLGLWAGEHGDGEGCTGCEC